jgi:general secretion pathway protein D
MTFEDASLNDVIRFISTTSRELDEDKAGVNILYMVSGDDDRSAPITVNLSQISVMDALRFVTEISGVHYRLDRGVVIIEREEPVANHGKAKPIDTHTEQKE